MSSHHHHSRKGGGGGGGGHTKASKGHQQQQQGAASSTTISGPASSVPISSVPRPGGVQSPQSKQFTAYLPEDVNAVIHNMGAGATS
eukprot:CAMPEP_0184696868 /NCGR_PEP_ID=MMETSP0313-20130426/4036_1 /TAXON_ID=2792 /ORGANISM="Porphyridium aerugineum, Strain SAG 1380-2" /LENGTH=86 /DNA_ID=CAMNT_0027155587 /DNA_START=555 /DNA_END=812 /DNA_ORIENTATION=+